MSRKQQGPRLYLRERKGRPSVLVIRDSDGYEESTGFGPSERGAAEAELARYITSKHRSAVGTHDPKVLPLGDVLNHYAEVKSAKPGAPKAQLEITKNRDFMIAHLLVFFGDKPTSIIRGAICRDYVRWRTHEGPAALGWPDRRARQVSDQTARRELVVLSAAINLYHKEYGLDVLPIVTMPAIAPTHRTAMTHSQAASLLAGALGFYREDGKRRRRPRSTRTQRKRTARFILIGLYSGTRSGAILAARWIPCLDGPWIDVDRGVLHRRGDLEVETNKRRPAAKIPPRLLAHLRRWRRMDMEDEAEPITYVIAKGNNPLAGKLRKGWTGARSDAGLDKRITPHVMRHTAGTWLAQGGVPARQAADFLGMSEDEFERTYYSADPDYQSEIGPAFDEAKRRANKLLRAPASPQKEVEKRERNAIIRELKP